jgi:hypothetical protein
MKISLQMIFTADAHLAQGEILHDEQQKKMSKISS